MDFKEQLEAEKKEGAAIKEKALEKDLAEKKKQEEKVKKEASLKKGKGFFSYRTSARSGLTSI